MKLAVLNFVVRENHFHKFRKDARSLLEEQLTIGRCGSNHDIAALLGLGAEISIENAVHRVHGLRTATQSQDRRICFCRIVAVRKDNLILNGGAADFLSLLEHFCSKGLSCKQDDSSNEYQLLHESSPSCSSRGL